MMSPRAQVILRWLPLIAIFILLGILLLEPVESWHKFRSAWFNKGGLTVALGLFVLLSPLTIGLLRGHRHVVLLAVVLAYAAFEALTPPIQIRADLLFLWPALFVSVLRWYRYSTEPHGSQ